MASKKSDDSKIAAILQYIFPVGLIWWLVDEKVKKNKFVTFHMKEVLALVIVAIVINIVASIIPFIGGIVFWAARLFILVLWVIGIYRAAIGESTPIPITGKLAEKF